jgi:hypothetical protein
MIPRLIVKKRCYINVKSEFVDQDEWNTEFIPKVSKFLPEEVLIINNLKNILPLWDAKSVRFEVTSSMLQYVMNEISRQFRSDNFDYRNNLTNAFEFFSKLCILSFLRNLPFQLKDDEYLANFKKN